MELTDILTISAIVIGPIAAVQIQKLLEQAQKIFAETLEKWVMDV